MVRPVNFVEFFVTIRQQSKISILLHQLDITPGDTGYSLPSEG